MAYYICNECKKITHEDNLSSYSDHVGDFWGAPAYQNFATCPDCGSDDLDELSESEMEILERAEHGNTETSDHLIICPYCLGETEVDIDMYYGDSDVEPYEEGTQYLVCPDCGHKFKFTKQLNWEYTSETMEDEDNEE